MALGFRAAVRDISSRKRGVTHRMSADAGADDNLISRGSRFDDWISISVPVDMLNCAAGLVRLGLPCRDLEKAEEGTETRNAGYHPRLTSPNRELPAEESLHPAGGGTR